MLFFLLCSAGSDANWSDPHSPCYECNDLSFKYILKHAGHSSRSVSAAAYFLCLNFPSSILNHQIYFFSDHLQIGKTCGFQNKQHAHISCCSFLPSSGNCFGTDWGETNHMRYHKSNKSYNLQRCLQWLSCAAWVINFQACSAEFIF